MNGSFMDSDRSIMLTEAKPVPDFFPPLTFSCSYLKNFLLLFYDFILKESFHL